MADKGTQNLQMCHLSSDTVIQSTFVISKSKGLYETLQDGFVILTSTYQICGTEENN